MVQLNVYHRVVDISCWYLTGYFYFHCFEIQQAQKLLEKWKLEKRKLLQQTWKSFMRFI